MKTTFRKPDKPRLHAWLDSAIDSLKDNTEYTIEIKQQRRKRSLNANAYAWVLLDKLAEFYGLPPEYIYRNALQSIGGVSVIINVAIEAEYQTRRIWESRGIGWQCERVDEDGERVNLKCTYGSSAFDTYQMSRLIDNIIQECKQVGIETISEAELESLIKEWKQ